MTRAHRHPQGGRLLPPRRDPPVRPQAAADRPQPHIVNGGRAAWFSSATTARRPPSARSRSPTRSSGTSRRPSCTSGSRRPNSSSRLVRRSAPRRSARRSPSSKRSRSSAPRGSPTRAWSSRATPASPPRRATEVGGGSVWRTIIDVADDIEADLIVVGARGLSTVQSVLLGSVSNAVVHHSSRPVLVVPRADEAHDTRGAP